MIFSISCTNKFSLGFWYKNSRSERMKRITKSPLKSSVKKMSFTSFVNMKDLQTFMYQLILMTAKLG